ncbi:MAG: TraB/GumN family protein, partial [Bacteroidales bacterium]
MKTILLAILFLATQQSLSAQVEAPPGFLWQVEINGSEFTLAGSIHASKKEHYPLPKGYLKEYKKSDFIIFELKDDFESIEEQIFAYAEKDKLEEGQYLDN